MEKQKEIKGWELHSVSHYRHSCQVILIILRFVHVIFLLRCLHSFALPIPYRMKATIRSVQFQAFQDLTLCSSLVSQLPLSFSRGSTERSSSSSPCLSFLLFLQKMLFPPISTCSNPSSTCPNHFFRERVPSQPEIVRASSSEFRESSSTLVSQHATFSLMLKPSICLSYLLHRFLAP